MLSPPSETLPCNGLRQRPGMAQWLRHCATSREAPGSIPGGLTGIFFRGTPDRTMCPEVKVSTRDFSWGKGGRCVWLTTYHPCRALIYPEPLGPSRSVAGDLYFLKDFVISEINSVHLTLFFSKIRFNNILIGTHWSYKLFFSPVMTTRISFPFISRNTMWI